LNIFFLKEIFFKRILGIDLLLSKIIFNAIKLFSNIKINLSVTDSNDSDQIFITLTVIYCGVPQLTPLPVLAAELTLSRFLFFVSPIRNSF
jgi:hypothetical protein